MSAWASDRESARRRRRASARRHAPLPSTLATGATTCLSVVCCVSATCVARQTLAFTSSRHFRKRSAQKVSPNKGAAGRASSLSTAAAHAHAQLMRTDGRTDLFATWSLGLPVWLCWSSSLRVDMRPTRTAIATAARRSNKSRRWLLFSETLGTHKRYRSLTQSRCATSSADDTHTQRVSINKRDANDRCWQSHLDDQSTWQHAWQTTSQRIDHSLACSFVHPLRDRPAASCMRTAIASTPTLTRTCT